MIIPRKEDQMESKKIINTNLKIINVGILNFYQSLIKQNADAVHVNWKPPLKKDEQIDSILSKIL